MSNEKMLSVRIPEELMKELKLKLINENITMKKYITNLIINDLSKKSAKIKKLNKK